MIDIRRLGQLVMNRIIAEVPEIGGRVTDKAIEGTASPYLTLGPISATDERAECIEAEEWVIQFDLWDTMSAKLKVAALAQKISNAVRGWSDEAEVTMHPLDVLPPIIEDDPDGMTVHCIIRVVAYLEGEDG